jgi:serine/threonine-protein kinase
MADEKTPVSSASSGAPSELSGRFGRYEIQGLLGRGGMGAVYRARQTDLDRPVCVKVIAPELARDAILVGRLQREARSAARVPSDNVVQVYEAGIENGIPFIAMELVEGRSVAEVLRDKGRLAPDEAVRIAIAAARGLEAAHKAAVLHRDVKPANLLLANDGRVKVADFGLAKLEKTEASRDATPGAPLSIAGEIVGTPDYMSPEQAEGGPLDGRTDLYQLGVTLYEMLTGVRPFRASSAIATLALVLTTPPPPLRSHVPEIPGALEAVCQKLMAKDPAGRPANATEAIALLEGASRALRRPHAATEVPRTIALPAQARPPAKPATFVVTKRAPEPSGGGWAVVALLVALLIPAALFARKLQKQTPPPAPVPVPVPAPVPDPVVPDPPAPPPVEPPAPPVASSPHDAGAAPAQVELIRAQEQVKKKDWAGAIDAASKAIELDPKLEPAWTLRAFAKFQKGDVAASEADLSRATELVPGNPTSWMNRAAARTQLGDVKGAIADYGKAIETGMRDPQVYFLRGTLKRQDGDDAGGTADYKRYLELAPEGPQAATVRAALDDLKR